MNSSEAMTYSLGVVSDVPEDGEFRSQMVFDRNGQPHWFAWDNDIPRMCSEAPTPFANSLAPYSGIKLETIMSIATKFVAKVVVLDPDTGLEVEVEIRKMETGPMVGLDGSFLDQMGPDEQPYSPYDKDTEIIVPDDEDPE